MGLKVWQVENCADMFAEGDTIPFISRYRKEKTGGMDDSEVAELKHWVDVFAEMEKRKETVLKTIDEAGALTDELRAKIENCVVSSELEDLYLPYRPKRRTRATVAKELGLEPLANAMWTLKARNPRAEAARFVKPGKVEDADAALAGARDIIAERLSETAVIRENLRQIFRARRVVSKVTKKAEGPEADKYRSYFNWSYPLDKVPSHSLLAILRAENEGFLSVSVDSDPERCGKKIYYDFCQAQGYPSGELDEQIREAVDDSFKRLLEPSISSEVLREAKEKADIESIRVFGDNLRQLLLGAPVGQKRTMAVDPGFRNGCKIACLDERGGLLYHTIIFPHPPQNEKVKALMAVQDMLEKYRIEAVAIGNGTASRETSDFFKKVMLPEGCKVWTVSEDGASIYSASEVGREEFPDEDVTVRGAVSIGRRLMDPLAELVKIDPKNLGIGQYQHDVDPDDKRVGAGGDADGAGGSAVGGELFLAVLDAGPQDEALRGANLQERRFDFGAEALVLRFQVQQRNVHGLLLGFTLVAGNHTRRRRKRTHFRAGTPEGTKMAERVGFEPTDRSTRSPDFESGALGRSAISPQDGRSFSASPPERQSVFAGTACPAATCRKEEKRT